jgi:hypothetical protein
MLLNSSLSNGCLLQLQEPYLQVGKPQFVTFKKLVQNEPEKWTAGGDGEVAGVKAHLLGVESNKWELYS